MTSENFNKILSFEGLMSAPYTAFDGKGELNLDVMPKYVDHLVKQGVKGVFVNGTTGEGTCLNVKERKDVAEAWVKHGKNKLEIIIIHIGANSLKDVQEMAAHAEKIGATGIAVLPPLFYKAETEAARILYSMDESADPCDNFYRFACGNFLRKHETWLRSHAISVGKNRRGLFAEVRDEVQLKLQKQLVEYFKHISSAAPTLPLMLYHFPDMSGVNLKLGTFLPKARAAIPNFVGAKFTSADVKDLLHCHRLTEKFKLISGYEEVLLPALACGATAAIGANYSFMAPLSLKIVEAYKKGNIEEARKHQNRVAEVHEKILKHGQAISCFKAVMNLVGPIDFGQPRSPLIPLDSKALENLKKDLKELKSEEWQRI